jgi:hypothetical protein
MQLPPFKRFKDALSQYQDSELDMPTRPNLKELVSQVALHDAAILEKKDKSYDGSWKNDGGIGAYFTLKRPMDRFVAIAKRNGYDIFKLLREELANGTFGQDGTFSAALQDLRRYLFLVETEVVAQVADEKRVDHYGASTMRSVKEAQAIVDEAKQS